MKQLLVRQAVKDGRPQSRMYEIHYEGGGEIPNELKGHYTAPEWANKDIKNWRIINKATLEAKKTKEEAMDRVAANMKAIAEERGAKEKAKQEKRKATLAAKEKAKQEKKD